MSSSIVVTLVLKDPLSVCNAEISVSFEEMFVTLVAIPVAKEALNVVSALVANVLTDALTAFNSASEAYVSSRALIDARLVAIPVAKLELKVVSAFVANVFTEALTALTSASVA